MRCFIAIDLPGEIKDYLFNLQKEFDNNLIKVKWVAKKNLHLTLKFLGEVDEKTLEEVKRKLKGIKIKKFLLKLEEVGLFPDENYVRVIWIGLKPDENIIKLQKLIDSELLDLFKGEQEFKAHLTLGRAKFVKDKEGFKALFKKIKIKDLEFKVDSFKLMKSTLTKDGPIYDVLELYTLD